MELLSKIRELRDLHTSDKKKTNTKQPIYELDDQRAILDRIKDTLDPTYSLWWRVAVSTGWRTADVCRLQFSDINFDDGTATIVVAKQTKAAEARAYNKALKTYRDELKRQAAMSGDLNRYMQLDQLDHKQLLDSDMITIEQRAELEALITDAVSRAPVKRDTKTLPKNVLNEIMERMERNIFDDYVFSRRLMAANSIKNKDGHLSRVGVWKALKAVFTWFTNAIGKKLKLSAYSSRKTFAYRMLRGKSGREQNLTEVMQAFGHSSIQMTMKYLGLSSKADELQRELAEL